MEIAASFRDDSPDRRDQLRRGAVFGQIAGGAAFQRPHRALDGRTPDSIYFDSLPQKLAA